MVEESWEHHAQLTCFADTCGHRRIWGFQVKELAEAESKVMCSELSAGLRNEHGISLVRCVEISDPKSHDE